MLTDHIYLIPPTLALLAVAFQFFSIRRSTKKGLARTAQNQKPPIFGMVSGNKTEWYMQHDWDDVFSGLLEWFTVIAFVGALLYSSLLLMNALVLNIEQGSNWAKIFIYITCSFLFTSLTWHYLAYVLGGQLMKISTKWTKSIDYPYYIIGVYFLFFSLVAYFDDSVQSKYGGLQALIGLVLLSLKITKTSAELFPNIFSPKDTGLRGFGGEIWTPARSRDRKRI